MSYLVRFFFTTAKQLEENEQDESSDSSDEGEFDEEDGPSAGRPATNQTSTKAQTLPAKLQNGNGASAFSFSRYCKSILDGHLY